MKRISQMLSTLGLLLVGFVILGLFARYQPDAAKTDLVLSPLALALVAALAVACFVLAVKISKKD